MSMFVSLAIIVASLLFVVLVWQAFKERKPGWDSLDKIEYWRKFFGSVVVWSLGIMTAAELLQRIYEDRCQKLQEIATANKIEAVKQLYAWRGFNDEERHQALEILRLAPKGSVGPFLYVADAETPNFVREMKTLLDEAGWEDHSATVAWPGGQSPPLVVQLSSETFRDENFTKAMEQVFKLAHVTPTYQVMKSDFPTTKNYLSFTVGSQTVKR